MNSLAPGKCGSNSNSITFEPILQNSALGTRCEIILRWMNDTGPHLWEIIISSDNSLVPSGITWANIDLDLCRHMMSLGHSELWLDTEYVRSNYSLLIKTYSTITAIARDRNPKTTDIHLNYFWL